MHFLLGISKVREILVSDTVTLNAISSFSKLLQVGEEKNKPAGTKYMVNCILHYLNAEVHCSCLKVY